MTTDSNNGNDRPWSAQEDRDLMAAFIAESDQAVAADRAYLERMRAVFFASPTHAAECRVIEARMMLVDSLRNLRHAERQLREASEPGAQATGGGSL